MKVVLLTFFMCCDLWMFARPGVPENLRQDNPDDRSLEFVPRIAFMQGWRSMTDISAALRYKNRTSHFFESHTVAAGVEWNYGFKKYLLGYKIGYTYLNECFVYTGLTGSINAVYFTDRSDFAWYIQPQLGWEGVEVFDIIAQYNIPLQHSELDGRVNHFSVGLRLWLN